ncbi:uncharacterized protein LOC130507525 [Raphanus sativus]|uniref:Uncharacterized protein LOC108824956 n=1 Tax=Raphanus sativus TaxID=3726 RepID=A0A6J0L2D2_RAPSA|nr:uncharacterized protein LOC108824956 [Raphanus sativus]XP_056858208.1 uncharacterized protein LOC130507525 [Raphanus sativus]
MECGKGYRPSYAWRSLLFGSELLKKGLIRSIGNGRSTYVWSQSWIMDDCPRRPVNKQREIDVNLRVESLLDDNHQWNVEKLQTLFPENEVARIRQLQVGNIADKDIWAFSDNGSYTVKSGYKLASLAKETEEVHSAVSRPGNFELKRKIWKVATTPKIRNFLWRAASGALAVAENLNTRGLNVDLPPMSSVSVTEGLSMLLQLMSDTTIPKSPRVAIPWILWTIWKNRNSLIYADSQESLVNQVQQALEEARLWEEVNGKEEEVVGIQGISAVSKKWEPPMAGFVKCNFHSNWRNASLHSGVAYLVRDQQGNVLHHARDAITFSPNRLTSELRCFIWVLKSLRDLGYQEIVCSSDCHEVMEAVMKPLGWPRYRILLQEITALCGSFHSVAFETESAHSNMVAHEISKSVLRYGRFQSYLALGGPAWLHHLIVRETS